MNYDCLLLSEKSINIFCDGSITKIDYSDGTYEQIGCPGYCIINNKGEIIEENYSVIIRNATNNITENRAIYFALYRAVCYARLGYDVNVFSDSQYCVYSFTKWIYNWIKNIYEGHMYNSSGEIVANEQLIYQVAALILNAGANINIYHQKGHVTLTNDSILNARRVFIISNNIKDDDQISIEFIKTISSMNDRVDKFTKFTLMNLDKSILKPEPVYMMPIQFDLEQFDTAQYKNNIKRRKYNE